MKLLYEVKGGQLVLLPQHIRTVYLLVTMITGQQVGGHPGYQILVTGHHDYPGMAFFLFKARLKYNPG